MADACMHIISSKQTDIIFPINISSGQEYSISELSYIIAKIIGYKGKINWDTNKPDGTYKKTLDTKRINQIGWKPTTNIEDGIALTYEWYLENLDVSI